MFLGFFYSFGLLTKYRGCELFLPPPPSSSFPSIITTYNFKPLMILLGLLLLNVMQPLPHLLHTCVVLVYTSVFSINLGFVFMLAWTCFSHGRNCNGIESSDWIPHLWMRCLASSGFWIAFPRLYTLFVRNF